MVFKPIATGIWMGSACDNSLTQTKESNLIPSELLQSPQDKNVFKLTCSSQTSGKLMFPAKLEYSPCCMFSLYESCLTFICQIMPSKTRLNIHRYFQKHACSELIMYL